eukprot:1158417-Pelagomonas_calceolata.AAC.2
MAEVGAKKKTDWADSAYGIGSSSLPLGALEGLMLLSRNPCTLREADFFMREAIDLSAPEKHEAMAHSSRSMIAVSSHLSATALDYFVACLCHDSLLAQHELAVSVHHALDFYVACLLVRSGRKCIRSLGRHCAFQRGRCYGSLLTQRDRCV